MKRTRILVGTDFSAAAESAVDRAVALAARFEAQLRVVHAVPPPGFAERMFPARREWGDEIAVRAATVLKERAARITDERIEVSTGLVTGWASAAISRAAGEFGADMIVVGARGESPGSPRSAGLGGTAYKLLRRARRPLLLVRRPGMALPHRVLAALDLGGSAEHVAAWAQKIAADADGSGLVALHVFEVPYAERLDAYGVSRKALDVYAGGELAERQTALRELLERVGVEARGGALVMRGNAVKTISAQLRKLEIDTLVIGKHTRRKRDAAAPYGSVCRRLAHFAPVDVLVVP